VYPVAGLAVIETWLPEAIAVPLMQVPLEFGEHELLLEMITPLLVGEGLTESVYGPPDGGVPVSNCTSSTQSTVSDPLTTLRPV
jgi:hypothetical protein